MAHAFGYLRPGKGGGDAQPARLRTGGRPVPRWLALALWILLGTSVVGAQTGPAGQVVRFTVFAVKPISDLAFLPRFGAAPLKIVFYPTARSPRYEFRGAMPLQFFDVTTGAIVAEATVPPGIRDALLLFSPIETAGGDGKKKSSISYRISVLDDGAARHAAGELSIINLSGLTLGGTVAKKDVTLRAGLNPNLKVGRSAVVALRTTFKQRSYQSYAGTIPLTAKQRALLILFPPFYQGSLEVQSRVLIDEPALLARTEQRTR